MNALPEPRPPEPSRDKARKGDAGGDGTTSPELTERDEKLENGKVENVVSPTGQPQWPTMAHPKTAPSPLLGPGRPRLPEDLRQCQLTVEDAARQQGLSFFPIVYEMLTSAEVNAVAARDGFPIRYPHWRFGMEYEFLNKSYEHGSSKIYELVINSDPVYAYLMDSNDRYDQEFVICHVTGHADFFKNNIYFAQTNRQSIDMMASHAERIRGYMHLHGRDEVEKVIDRALSVADLIDPFQMLVPSRPTQSPQSQINQNDFTERGPGRIKTSRDYLESFVNPPDLLKEIRDAEDKKREQAGSTFPERPVRDVMQFLIEHAPLPDWQRDILSMVREEAYYFLPQQQTKIMNEGWASYWHSELMRTVVLDEDRLVPFAHLHSGITATSPHRLNPYKLGIELFRDIEDRWNKGKFGPEWENCTNITEKEHWDKKTGLGREKIFEVRRLNNDISFISNYLTMEFCEKHQLFTFNQNAATGDYVIRSREFENVRDTLVRQLINGGKPVIHLTNANVQNRGELLLEHTFEKDPLREDYTKAVLENIHYFWKKPVNIDSELHGSKIRCSFDHIGYRRRAL